MPVPGYMAGEAGNFPPLLAGHCGFNPSPALSDLPFQDYLLYTKGSVDGPGSQKRQTSILFQIV